MAQPTVAGKVLMIEDDFRLATMVRSYLAANGFEVAVADDAARGLKMAALQPYSAILLDLMLPDADGFDVCRQLRASTDVPIIMVTARGDIADRVVGLELGADDYLPKPFEPRELLARLRAVTRRRRASGAGAPLRFGRLELDPSMRTVSLDGQLCDLTGRQFDILWTMAQRPGHVFSRDALIDAIGHDTSDAMSRAIDVHIAKIRAVIEDDVKHPRRIITVRGAGYMFARTSVN